MTVPSAVDPWAGLVPDLPQPVPGIAPDLPGSAPFEATATARLAGAAPTRFDGVPVGPSRTNVLLKVVVSVLEVSLAGGTAAA